MNLTFKCAPLTRGLLRNHGACTPKIRIVTTKATTRTRSHTQRVCPKDVVLFETPSGVLWESGFLGSRSSGSVGPVTSGFPLRQKTPAKARVFARLWIPAPFAANRRQIHRRQAVCSLNSYLSRRFHSTCYVKKFQNIATAAPREMPSTTIPILMARSSDPVRLAQRP